MDESKPLEEIRNWEHPPWYGIVQFKERVILTFLENQKGLFHNLKTHFRLPVKLWTISGPCREASYTAITLNPESNFTRREKNHSLFHWNTLTYPELLIRIWMSSRRSALIIIGTLMALETCQIPWTGFTQFTLLDEKAPDGFTLSGRRLTIKQLTSRPDHLWPDLWKSMGKNAKLKEKQKWSEEKIHLDNARKLRGIYFIDPEDKEYKETIKNARKKLETSVALAMPCKIVKKKMWVVHIIKSKQNLRVFWKLVNLQDCVWENHCRLIMKTILQEKVTIHYSTTIWFTSLFLCLKPWKFLQQSRQGMGELEKIFGVELDKSQK